MPLLTDTYNVSFRCYLDEHVNSACDKAIIDCSFSGQGCSEQLLRKDLEKHLQDKMSSHMLLLAAEKQTFEKRTRQSQSKHAMGDIAIPLPTGVFSFFYLPLGFLCPMVKDWYRAPNKEFTRLPVVTCQI